MSYNFQSDSALHGELTVYMAHSQARTVTVGDEPSRWTVQVGKRPQVR